MFLLVSFDPHLVAVAVRYSKAVERNTTSGARGHAKYVVGREISFFFRAALEAGKGDVLIELLPRAQSSAMVCMDDDTKSFVSRDTDVEANEEERENEEPPPSGRVA